MNEAERSEELLGMPCSAFYWAWLTTCLCVLIPRQDGKGWLKCPASDRATKRTFALERESGVDVCGLDGYLEFETGSEVAVYDDKRKEFEAKAIPIVEQWFKVPAGREVGFDDISQFLIR